MDAPKGVGLERGAGLRGKAVAVSNRGDGDAEDGGQESQGQTGWKEQAGLQHGGGGRQPGPWCRCIWLLF